MHNMTFINLLIRIIRENATKEKIENTKVEALKNKILSAYIKNPSCFFETSIFNPLIEIGYSLPNSINVDIIIKLVKKVHKLSHSNKNNNYRNLFYDFLLYNDSFLSENANAVKTALATTKRTPADYIFSDVRSYLVVHSIREIDLSWQHILIDNIFLKKEINNNLFKQYKI